MSANEDWDLFRHFLRIIQILGEFITQYEQLEGDIVKKIQINFIKASSNNSIGSSSLLAKLAAPQPDSNNDNILKAQLVADKDVLLDEMDRIKLNTLISNVEAGTLSIF